MYSQVTQKIFQEFSTFPLDSFISNIQHPKTIVSKIPFFHRYAHNPSHPYDFNLGKEIANTSNSHTFMGRNGADNLEEGSFAFKAYYLPTIQGEVNEVTLGDKCDVFLTDPLSGCSVIATRTADNKTKVYHINFLDDQDYIDQKKADEFMHELSKKEHILFQINPTEYKHFSWVPVCGLRNDNGEWSFHYQFQTQNGLSHVSSMNGQQTQDMLESIESASKHARISEY